MNKPCDYCGADLPEGVDKRTRRQRSAHFAVCSARLATTQQVVRPLPTEYLLVADHDSKILKSSSDRHELVRLADTIRKAGGAVTIFKSTPM